MVADEEDGDPEGGEGLEDEDGGGFLVLAVDELESVEDECLDAVDGGAESQDLPGDGHGGPEGISLPYAA